MPPRKKPAAAAKSAPRRQPAKPKSGTKAKGARKSISKPAITGKPESKAFTKKLVKVKQEVKKEKIRQANLRAKQRASAPPMMMTPTTTPTATTTGAATPRRSRRRRSRRSRRQPTTTTTTRSRRQPTTTTTAHLLRARCSCAGGAAHGTSDVDRGALLPGAGGRRRHQIRNHRYIRGSWLETAHGWTRKVLSAPQTFLLVSFGSCEDAALAVRMGGEAARSLEWRS